MSVTTLAPERAGAYAHDFKGKRTLKSFEAIDQMPPELKACVHEFGFPIVSVLVKYGITRPGQIRDIVRECWEGARQSTQRKTGPKGTLDWLLIQAGAQISAAALIRFLANSDLVIVPGEPSNPMVAASIDAVNHMGVVSKSTKHRNRLRAAIKVGAVKV